MGLKKYEKLRMEVKEESRKLHRLGVNCIDLRMRKKLLSKTEFYKKRVNSNQGGGGFQEWETSDKGKLREANYIKKGEIHEN